MRENRYFLLGLLTLIGVLNFVDRYILSILLEAIKDDLLLTDAQLGMLSGFYFAVFYALFGIPIAVVADRWHRGKIISLSLMMWSAMTLVSAFATSFIHLIVARIGVGLGEAGVAPASHSLITERFTPRQRPLAFAVYAVGGTVGILVALWAGGWINEHYGWRTAFMAAGAPGILLAGVAWLLLHETRRPAPLSFGMLAAAEGQVGIFQGLVNLWRIPAWRHVAIASALTHVATFGIGQFMPSLFSRSFGLSSSETGFILALVIGLGGSIGAMTGGAVAGRLAGSRGIGWMGYTLFITFTAASMLAPLALMQSDLPMLLWFLAPYYVLSLTSSGVQFAIAQSMVRSNMRAMSSALLILANNLIGLGLGPLIVGQISDMLEPSFGRESLRYAMMCMTPLLFWGAIHFYISGRNLKNDAIDDNEAGGAAPAH